MKTIHLIRKPCSEGSVGLNVLQHEGAGGLNIDSCRIALGDDVDPNRMQRQQSNRITWEGGTTSGFKADHTQPLFNVKGRWPANVVLLHTSACEISCKKDCVLSTFADVTKNTTKQGAPKRKDTAEKSFLGTQHGGAISTFYGDEGSAVRFFKNIQGDLK